VGLQCTHLHTITWAVMIEPPSYLQTAPGSTPCMPGCFESTSWANTVELAGDMHTRRGKTGL
jgi:hypothetical protein